MNRKIILASASARRKEILEGLGLEFTVMVSNAAEEVDNSLKPGDIAMSIALIKAKSVYKKVSEAKDCGNAIIIGADTIVVAGSEDDPGRRIIGKPETAEAAGSMLRSLSGTVNYVYTGLAVIDSNSHKNITGYEKSTVRMKELSEQEINSAAARHLDKAGGYGIQEKDDAFVTLVDGSYDNVVGLPTKKLKQILGEFGIM
jgi:septum formation protein